MKDIENRLQATKCYLRNTQERIKEDKYTEISSSKLSEMIDNTITIINHFNSTVESYGTNPTIKKKTAEDMKRKYHELLDKTDGKCEECLKCLEGW